MVRIGWLYHMIPFFSKSDFYVLVYAQGYAAMTVTADFQAVKWPPWAAVWELSVHLSLSPDFFLVSFRMPRKTMGWLSPPPRFQKTSQTKKWQVSEPWPWGLSIFLSVLLGPWVQKPSIFLTIFTAGDKDRVPRHSHSRYPQSSWLLAAVGPGSGAGNWGEPGSAKAPFRRGKDGEATRPDQEQVQHKVGEGPGFESHLPTYSLCFLGQDASPLLPLYLPMNNGNNSSVWRSKWNGGWDISHVCHTSQRCFKLANGFPYYSEKRFLQGLLESNLSLATFLACFLLPHYPGQSVSCCSWNTPGTFPPWGLCTADLSG